MKKAASRPSAAVVTQRVTTHCVVGDASGTRDMIRAGGGTVVTTRRTTVTAADGSRVPGFVLGYDLPLR